MARGSFLGHETLGPEDNHPPGHLPGDSPRHHDNRNDHHDRTLDARLTRLRSGGPRLVRRHDGHVITLPAHVALKPGWVELNQSDLDAPVDMVSPFTGEVTGSTTEREHLLGRIDHDAHQLSPFPRRAERYRYMDGEWVRPVDDDRDIYQSGGKVRAELADMVKGRKP